MLIDDEEGNTISTDHERRRPRNLIWLPKKTGALTTLCRGAVLTVDQRGNQYPWTVEVDGHKVGEGVSPSAELAMDAAVDAAVEVAGGGRRARQP